ncbi:MAG TPA: transporter substrate-binding domain-containing protein [Patescibacteria group bacterium]|nr:transporter substrate-binding domain-containing protein [Patescibacteria group bacterium]
MLGGLLRIVAMMVVLSSAASATELAKLYDYHLFPPFVTEPGHGLTYDFAVYLAEASGGAYDIQVEALPRRRFDAAIDAESGRYVSPWLMPDWLGDTGMTKYAWSKPLLHDSDDLLSRAAKPFDYSGPESLFGKEVGANLGYVYPVITEYFASGAVTRVDVPREEQIVKMLASDRLNIAIVPGVAARYYVRQLGLRDRIHFSPRPLYSYDRRALMHGDAAWVAFLRKTVEAAPHDPKWQAILARYGLD